MKTQDKTAGTESKAHESIPVHSQPDNADSKHNSKMTHKTWQHGKLPAKPAPAADDKEAKSESKNDVVPAVEISQPAAVTQLADKASNENVSPVQLPYVKQWVVYISEHVEDSALSVIELGNAFIKAKAALTHGKWQELFQPGNLRFSQRSAEKLIQVAQHVALAKPPNSASLPPSLDALTLLARVNADVVQSGIDDGTIQPTMTIAEAKKFALDMLGPESAKIKKPFDRDATIKSLISRVSKALDEVPANQREDFISTLVEDIKKAIH